MKTERFIKIRYHSTDVGFCTEIWETEELANGPLYFGRDPKQDKTWWILTDAPYGFCEMNSPVGKHVTLIICDEKWSELGRDGNDLERFPKRFVTTKSTEV